MVDERVGVEKYLIFGREMGEYHGDPYWPNSPSSSN